MEFPPEIRGFVFFEVVQKDNQQKACSRSENQSVSSIFSKPIEFDGPKTQKAWLVYDFIHVHTVGPYQLLMGLYSLSGQGYNPSYAIYRDEMTTPLLTGLFKRPTLYIFVLFFFPTLLTAMIRSKGIFL